MARRALEVTPPAPKTLHRQSPSSGNSSALLFVIGGMLVLVILLIVILLFWKFNKPEKLRKFLKRNGSLAGNRTAECLPYYEVNIEVVIFTATKDFWSGSPQTISYFDFQTLKKATKNFHPGYTAPEYAIRGELSEKADIYSFGVLVLEIISCRKNTDLRLPSEMQYLPEYAWKLYERSSVIDLVDPKLREHGFMEKDVLLVIHVAFLCLQPLANLRPPMSKIEALLTCKVEMVGTPMRPAFLERRRKTDENLSWDAISEVFFSPLHSESPSVASTTKLRIREMRRSIIRHVSFC
uniref:Serine-threonine/tyrosine-protein kinase catalytic domain-containing protein n=1 Tax=Populus alba TaxID=43335 RepID=A0A4U5QIK7_POPAL|nr:hypothetical protein D5086_0000084510 [Populus alba]